MRDLLKEFNRVYKEADVIYHNYAKSCGLSDAAFWTLYSICEHNTPFTQKELCQAWSFPPQTVNSALKDLEKRGIVSLELVPNSRKNKWIKLTKAGIALTERTISPLMRMECESFGTLSDSECELMLSTTGRYFAALKERICKETDDKQKIKNV